MPNETGTEDKRMNLDMNMHDMKMSFYFGTEGIQMFLENWKIETKFQLIGACLAIMMLTFIGEGIRLWQETRICVKSGYVYF